MLPVAAFVEDKRGRILFANTTAKTLWKTHNVIGKSIAFLFENRKLEFAIRRAEARALREMAAQISSNLRDGAHFFLMLFPVIDSEGEVLLVGLVVRTHG